MIMTGEYGGLFGCEKMDSGLYKLHLTYPLQANLSVEYTEKEVIEVIAALSAMITEKDTRKPNTVSNEGVRREEF